MTTILITGGTGTLGKEIVKQYSTIHDKTIIFSRDEFKQSEMAKIYPEGGSKGIRYLLGDVRDESRLNVALKNVDIVIHTAAMKRIEECEYNIEECHKTNVIGTFNVAKACVLNNVNKALFISTDKAVDPVTSYGVSKLFGERAWINSNNLGKTKFSCVRYGNVMGSRGSVFKHWEDLAAKNEPLPVTHPDMTRFFWSIEEAASFIFKTICKMFGGEIFLPKMKKYGILDLAKKIKDDYKITGLREYEKIHESLIMKEEVRGCWETKNSFIVYPHFHHWAKDLYLQHNSIKVPDDFTYNSEIK